MANALQQCGDGRLHRMVECARIALCECRDVVLAVVFAAVDPRDETDGSKTLKKKV